MLLYELHDRARAAGIEGYRRMSKAELAAALDIELDEAAPAPTRAPAGPTEVDVAHRNGFALLTLQTLAEIVKRIAWLRHEYEMDTHYERPLQ